ncbi:MAG: transcription-repair coupling factor [Bacteroidetes bacterium MED-G17]|nr:MAG: transcription-repair coupling factor [Bacteroidetes bacterium MED-G17]|tara:strand:- start:3241 stop:6537 length:3297 start_codon:yes stop_codon:yes gene_type:complete
MRVEHLIEFYAKDRLVNQWVEEILSEKKGAWSIEGAKGSFEALLIAHGFKSKQENTLLILEDEDTAGNFANDLNLFLAEERAFVLNSSFKRRFDPSYQNKNSVQEKAEIIQNLTIGKKAKIVICHPESLSEKIISSSAFEKNKLLFQIGDEFDFEFLIESLNSYGFSREDFVYEPGQFAIRGGIVDIFSFSSEVPYRLELAGLKIESIRQFDPITQLSIKEMAFTHIVPNIQEDEISGNRVGLLSYFKQPSLIFCKQLPSVLNTIEKGLKKVPKNVNSSEIYENVVDIENQLQAHCIIELEGQKYFKSKGSFNFETKQQAHFNKNFHLFAEELNANSKIGIMNIIGSSQVKQIDRISSILEDLGKSVNFEPLYEGFSSGFYDARNKVAMYTDHQLFGRHFQYKLKSKYSTNQALSIKELKNLNPGDFIVHIDHGVGQFEGLQKIEIAGKFKEAVRIRYKNNDLLYVNIASLHKISKYVGKEGTPPKLNKLGSDAWQNLKRKTKKRIKDIARDLIKLYAKRKSEKGFAFSPDSYLQIEMEASFLYEDTPDQAKASEEVKRDMEKNYPMDRLICGDVGFGKTEIAMRAAFKAATDSKQVAILVPTTILAQQHYYSFRKRLKDFPVHVDYINRFRTQKDVSQVLSKLKEGKIDILIGTHKLLSKSTQFKDLGLLIIDEEQKFGVSAKEKLKEIRVNVDTLTLTATPIPRTLHFSLMGARDLSIIQTPPPNRRPIQTQIHTFNHDTLKEAVENEIARKGQIFFIHNRVRDIEEYALLIKSLVPEAKVAVGHGQMPGDQLENVMLKFIEGDFDVLVATTIIESGLDITNANTIIINNAHAYGLSDLHQMRGRVGRSNTKAYALMFCPPIHALNDDARRRMQAIEEFSDLGSGFGIAMRDLDIRGAGNLLGGEQSGFIADIGFNTYHKILDEAIAELKDDEFKNLFDHKQDNKYIHTDTVVETDLDANIPENYVSSTAERLSLYNQVSQIENKAQMESFVKQLNDRFGELPKEVFQLLNCLKIKWIGQKLHFSKVSFKKRSLRCHFSDNLDEDYFQGPQFGALLMYIQNHPHKVSLEQKGEKLSIRFKEVNNLAEANKSLEKLL